MNFLFDTNILLYYLTKNPLSEKLDDKLRPFDPSNFSIISIVTEGELKSLAYQRNWGEKKLENVQQMLNQFLRVPIQSNDLVTAYAEIDIYSQGKSQKHELSQRIYISKHGQKRSLDRGNSLGNEFYDFNER
jgi:predicted nucleic acid-binding protein